MLINLILVGLGGAAGSIARYLSAHYIKRVDFGPAINQFPISTFLVNIIGCFIIGVAFSSLIRGSNHWLLFVVGFCGGFTTFSTFALENLNLLQAQQLLPVLIYTSLSIILGFIAVWLGMQIKLA